MSSSSKSAFPAPPVRRLRGFTFDPSLSAKLETAQANEAVFTLPWEHDLLPGPVGEYLEVLDYDPASQAWYEPVDLNDPHLLAQDGLAPSAGNPKFHQQMVYAVAMTTIKNFERALGRPAMWALRRRKISPLAEKWKTKRRITIEEQRSLWVERLRIYPHALREANAYYSPEKRALLFGYFPASAAGDVYPFGTVFTCLSHDIVAHETTHALLDGMHPRFIEASHADVLAFHEAFADIVALFQHFTFPEVLRQQIARTRGNLETENLLGALAQEFGRATGGRGALRDAIGHEDESGVWQRQQPDPTALDRIDEPHGRGAILVAAVFDAFLTIYNSRISDLKRIATEGSGVLPAGDIHPDLVNRLANEAAKTARQVLNMCIRALDYCPPVDINFGDYLRALITADMDLVPDDPRRYRLAIIDAFRARGIYPRGLRALSEESLQWDRMPEEATEEPALGIVLKKAMSFFTKFRWFGSRFDTWRSTQFVKIRIHKILESEVEYTSEFEAQTGLAMSAKSALEGMRMSEAGNKPSFEVHSLWPIQRVRPDGTTLNQVVGSIIQTCDIKAEGGDTFLFRGGCTMIIDLDTMKLRYCVRKPINQQEGRPRLERHRAFRQSQIGVGLRATYFGGLETSRKEPFALLHADHD
jgi:hypothetical protein